MNIKEQKWLTQTCAQRAWVVGSTPAGTNVSHWWWQDEHSAKIARVPVKDLRHVQALEQ